MEMNDHLATYRYRRHRDEQSDFPHQRKYGSIQDTLGAIASHLERLQEDRNKLISISVPRRGTWFTKVPQKNA